MNRQLWLNRGLATLILGCIFLSLAGLVSIFDNLSAVDQAREPLVSADLPRATSSNATVVAKPALRAGVGEPSVAIGEYLNGQLGSLGLSITTITVPSVRPLGGGVRLAEVRVQTKAQADQIAALAQWAAVNHEAIRLKSVVLGMTPEGEGTASFILLMAIV